MVSLQMKSDAQLRRDVEDELATEPSLDATAIGVAVIDGIVSLSGHVASYSEKLVADRRVARVVGRRRNRQLARYQASWLEPGNR